MLSPARSYSEVHRQSIDDPDGFWGEAAQAIVWDRPFNKVLDTSLPPFYRWFSGGKLNTCYNCIDRHIDEGRGEQLALIYDSPVTNTIRRYSYNELRDKTARFAGVLAAQGVVKGDRVLIYMPMVPETVIAMLACARLGAIHSVVFGGFAPNELAKRINDARPKLIVSASCGIETNRVVEYKPMLDEAIHMATVKPNRCIILQRPQTMAMLTLGRDLDWAEEMANAEPAACVSVEATDPLYILYTSGSTGVPKGIVRDNGGHAVAMKWSMEYVYNVKPGEVYWAASDVGWVVGHSYIVYGPLLQGCTTVLFEGKPVGTPDAGVFWRVVAEHNVSTLFTAPTAFRAIRRVDPTGELIKMYGKNQLRALFLAGERCDPDTLVWAEQQLGVPVVDHWWQTETGWAIAANCLGIEPFSVKPGSATKAAPGYDVRVLNVDGNEVSPDTMGNICVRLPLPPGSLPTLWQNERHFKEYYLDPYPGYYLSGDAGYQDADGYLWVMGRIDDIINIAGHRLSTGAMEEVLASHPDIAECAVISVWDELKGELPLGLIVLKSGVDRPHADIVKEVVQKVRAEIGPVAAFKSAVVVARLPKTRSGKILRASMRKIADGDDFKIPATIDDPAILSEIADALKPIGYAQQRS
ncbi:propionyl-CoA synthetase [Cerasicoccus arenae]|uniref:Propionyl-CoA synthetase n=1 Tax=Cerasicoccus arenae TaxID=424488 RepID=A0A8J3DIC3_9BACT|nr:propionyl-CoA synthetase [Cerasicoccus arenae]MBK1859621.1 propionyl-CoA synthetase [Cerasicoccus arenae]GHB96313.1 propionyl-CoA synthetase [Cerasicoccus arenae]